jgi:hypothetical protein
MEHFNKLFYVTILIVIYVLLKIYVINTPTKDDDAIPDKLIHFFSS